MPLFHLVESMRRIHEAIQKVADEENESRKDPP